MCSFPEGVVGRPQEAAAGASLAPDRSTPENRPPRDDPGYPRRDRSRLFPVRIVVRESMNVARRRPAGRSGRQRLASTLFNPASAAGPIGLRAARRAVPESHTNRPPPAVAGCDGADGHGPAGRSRRRSRAAAIKEQSTMRLRDRQRRRPSRRHAFRPAREDLEPRIALSGAQIGVNLDSTPPAPTSPIWTDLHNIANAWWRTDENYRHADHPAHRRRLSPGERPDHVRHDRTIPTGNYEFSYTGSGDRLVLRHRPARRPRHHLQRRDHRHHRGQPLAGRPTYLDMSVTNINHVQPHGQLPPDVARLRQRHHARADVHPGLHPVARAVLRHPLHELGRDQRLHAGQLAGPRPAQRVPHRRHRRRPLRGHDRAVQRGPEGHVDQHPGRWPRRSSSRASPS